MESARQLRGRLINPNLKRIIIFNETLCGADLIQSEVYLDRPVYLGFCILEFSKLLMYQLLYDHIIPHYGLENVQLGKMDTDSFLLKLTCADMYADFGGPLAHIMDLSNYPTEHPIYDVTHKSIPGYLKDELGGTPLIEFCGIKPKLYCQISADDGCKKVCKGIKKYVIQKKLRMENYKNALRENELTYVSINNIESNKHVVSTVTRRKLAINPLDTKRYWVDGTHSRALGHWRNT